MTPPPVGLILDIPVKDRGPCAFAGCGRPVAALRWCSAHWQQQHRGETLRPILSPGRPSALVIDGDVAWIVLTNRRGEETGRAAIDVSDVPMVSQHRWMISRTRHHRYVKRADQVYLHRFLTGAPAGSEVDHRDNDGLNNRRSNLWVTDRQGNAQNTARRGHEADRGVRFRRDCANPWEARVTSGGRGVVAGFFATKAEAVAAVRALRAQVLPLANENRHKEPV